MPDFDSAIARHVGGYGEAAAVPIPDRPDAAETVCTWLLTAPIYHPLWSQYALMVARLRDNVPGFPQPVRKFIGATHELLVVALNPDAGPQTVESLFATDSLRYLTPVNICEQFEATDDELRQLAWFAAWAVVNGGLCPETADAPTRIREGWLTALTKTLAHVRGEVHAP
jgi:hypothetical protein